MEPTSPSTSHRPRPLATKPDYIRRSHTSKAGLYDYTSTFIPSDSVELDRFDFKRPLDESLLQPNAKRARKIYRSILRDQAFLLDLKQLWVNKLKQLQVEHASLSQMSKYTQEDVNDLPPLFSQVSFDQQQQSMQQGVFQLQHPELLPDLQNVWSASSSQPDSPSPPPPPPPPHTTYPDEQDTYHDEADTSDSSYKPSWAQDVKETKPDSSSTGSYCYENDNNDDDGDVEDDYDLADEEDEETARQALTFMLANYGTDL